MLNLLVLAIRQCMLLIGLMLYLYGLHLIDIAKAIT